MPCNFELTLSSIAESISSNLTMHIHLTILVSFAFNLITSSSLTGQGFAPKGKSPLVNK